MTVVLSNSFDRLVDALTEKLLISPHTANWILLPASINKQWLLLELVKRMPQQAVCGISVFGWKEALKKLGFFGPHFFEVGCVLASADWFGKEQHPLIWRLSRQAQDLSLYELKHTHAWQESLLHAVNLLRKETQKSQDLIIHSFGVEDYSDVAWQFVLERRAHIYLFSPCQMFWGDCCSDRQRHFLTSKIRSESSRSAMETFLRDSHPLLANWGHLTRAALKRVEDFETEERYEEWEGTSVLRMLQRDLLRLRTSSEGLSPLPVDPSIQIVGAGASKRNEVTLIREEIVRLVSEEGFSYSDIVIFSPDIQSYAALIEYVFGPEIPICIGPLFSLSPFCHSLLLFFQFIQGDWDADGLMELLEQEAFSTKHSLDSESLAWFRLWMKEARVRSGWDHVLKGIERMRKGLIILLPEEEGPVRIETIDWGQAEQLELFITLVHLLKQEQEVLRQARPLREWAEELRRCVQVLFHGEQDGHWAAFIQMLLTTSLTLPSQIFEYAFIVSAFEEHCNQARKKSGSFLVDAIDCLSLSPGAVRPARALFLIGVDQEQFPRSDEHSSFDFALNKVDSADLDRSLLLQLLCAAKEQLFISYCHLSGEDGQALELAQPIQELVDLLDCFYGIKGFPLIKTSLEGGSKVIKKEWPRVKSSGKECRAWRLSDLTLLMRDPWRYFLQKSYGIFLKRERSFSERAFRECVLSYEEEKRLLRKLDRERLPRGPFGVLAEERIAFKQAERKRFFDSWGETILFSKAHPIVLEGGCTVFGRVEDARPGELFVEGELNLLSLLRCWPSFLAVYTLSPSPGTICSLKTGKKRTFEGLDPKRALSQLIEYAKRSEECLSPLTSFWADHFLRGKEKQDPDDALSRWVLDRYQQPSFDQLHKEWDILLQEVFHALL